MNAKAWTPEDSASLYNLKGWGLKYFGVSSEGNLLVHPRRAVDTAIDLKRVVDDVVSRGVKLPVLFRFHEILRHRVELLNETFRKAIAERKYGGRYLGVYPIKVNQLREVVEEILEAGEPFQFGLEAGSKGELLAVLALNGPEALTIVNGYKDETMMRLALLGLQIGKKVIVVIEKPAEIALVAKAAKAAGVVPMIGLRARLQTPGSGKWKYSTGPYAKFGLTTPEILSAVQELKSLSLLDAVKLVHFHIGSQVTDVQTIKDAVKEGARVYAKLREAGLKGLEYLDCGGGLGVDYDGTHSAVDSSTNYNLKEYVAALVSTVQEVCQQEKVPEPHLVTESGRATVAHHSLLVVNVFGEIEAGSSPATATAAPHEAEQGSGCGKQPQSATAEHALVTGLRGLIAGLTSKNLAQSYHEGTARRDEAYSLFTLGYLGLEDRAETEVLFSRLCQEIAKMLPRVKDAPEELVEMAKTFRDQFLCNFSIFQSVPDSWAIGQLFPIMPIQRLHEEPERRAALVDVTCDSDGKIAQFACHRRAGGTLPLHSLRAGEPYYLGVFLMGAYQATMGDIHNLFGRVNEVHVFADAEEPSGYYIEEILPGQTVREVLSSVQYSDFELVKMVRSAIDARVKAGAIKPREGVELLDQYESVLGQYTYIDQMESPEKTPALPAPAAAEPAAVLHKQTV